MDLNLINNITGNILEESKSQEKFNISPGDFEWTVSYRVPLEVINPNTLNESTDYCSVKKTYTIESERGNKYIGKISLQLDIAVHSQKKPAPLLKKMEELILNYGKEKNGST